MGGSRGIVLAGTAALCAFLAACPSGLFGRREKVKPQEWDASRGPVIPHDSFPTDCQLCHEGKNWHTIKADFAFDHGKETGVPLAGAHAQAECLRCHNDRGAVALFAKKGCAGCHEDIHRGELDRNCASCHSENHWNPGGVYAAHAATRFPLTGSHIAVACSRCHKEAQVGNFRGADPRCESCHQKELVRAKKPDHALLGLSQNCQNCHKPTAWTGAHFNHAGIYTGCVQCHLPEYNATTSPNHLASGYPTSCENCHNTTSWTGGAPLNHRFNIRSGPHATYSCAECHRVPNNWASVSCTHCHRHLQPEMADKHSGVNGYTWSSPACISCHPTGR